MSFPLTNLRAFEAGARLLSFTLAADELHLTQSAVSQQIKQLETRLGFRVFHRLTRRLELTDQGRQLYEAVRRSLHDLDLAVETLRGETMHGSVVLNTGSTFAANWLIPRLGRFRETYPGIELRIQPSDELLDLDTHPAIDLAVRFGHGAKKSMIVERLGQEQVFVAASPSLLRHVEPPCKVEDLARFTLIHNDVSDREPDSAGDWRNWLNSLGMSGALDVTSGPRYPRSDLVVHAAVHGQGVALVWDTMVLNELADNRLVKVFDGLFETAYSYIAWCTPHAFSKPKVHAVMDWLRFEASA